VSTRKSGRHSGIPELRPSSDNVSIPHGTRSASAARHLAPNGSMSTAQAPAQAAIIPFMRGALPIAAAGADYRGVLRSYPKRRWLGSARSVLPLCFGFPWRRDVTLGMTVAGDMAPSFACTANTVALQLVIAEPTFTRIDQPLRVAGVSNGNAGT
jgi:hypothetical protein